MNKEIIKLICDITEIALQNNKPEQEIGEMSNLMYFVSFQAHVNQFSVTVAYQHFSIKIYEKELYIDGSHSSGEDAIIQSLTIIKTDLQKIAKGKFSVKHNITLAHDVEWRADNEDPNKYPVDMLDPA